MVNKDGLLHLLRIHGVGGKLLNNIKNKYINSFACVTAKDENESYWVYSAVRQGCVMSSWAFNVRLYIDRVINEVKMGMRGMMW